MKKNQDLSRIKSRNDIPFGTLLMGTTGVLIGLVVDSAMAMIFVGILGALIGGLVGWAGGRVFLIIICFGVLIGAFLGYRTGDRDILIIAAGTGGAIAGFMGAQVSLFFNK
jgi:hypothetical protein|tara:strand:- start:39 stop:371 length:333 start_codon:yes stop_codon:yes gene_type:complete